MKLNQKAIVVTGGGSGMGRELVLQLLARGASVAAIDIQPAALEETRQLSGENANKLALHVVNVTDRAAVEKLPEAVLARFGAVDGLINNAGVIQPFVKLNELAYDAIERVMNINFYGTLYMTKAFLPYLLKRPEAHIVNVSSMGGFLPVPGQTVYGASKAAVKLMTEGLNSELLNTNVRVTVVFPGAMNTNIARNSGVAISSGADSGKSSFKMLEPSKAAEIILSGVEKNRYRILVGPDSQFMDFLCRLNPEGAAKFIFNQMKSLLAE